MYNAYVVEINDLQKHPNADKLQIAKVFGLSVIVGQDVHEGDIMVYFPSDGQLNKEFAEYCNLLRKKDENGNNIGGYMDERKRNIKAIKLRGEYSDGLLIPINKLTNFLKLDKDYFDVGDVINTVDGVEICKKYVPQRNNKQEFTPKTTKKNNKDKYPLFHEHIDTKQLAYNYGELMDGDRLTITLKTHGTSARTSNTKLIEKQGLFKRIINAINNKYSEYKTVSGTRRVVLDNFDGGYYGSNEFRKKYHDLFDGKLYKGETVYYEIVGHTESGQLIMPQCDNKKLNDKEFVKRYGETTSFTYGCSDGESDIYVYRMSMTNEDGVEIDYSTEYTILRCEQMGVKHVPVIKTIDNFSINDIDEFRNYINEISDGADLIDPTHIREGVVVRVENRLNFTAYKNKGITFKILEGIIKENATSPDMEEQEG